jgi:hypothetical protein
LVEEVTDLFDEDAKEIFVSAIGGNVDLARVAAVTAPKARHGGRGKDVNGRQERKVGLTKGGEVPESRGPMKMATVDALQIGFGGRAGSPTNERKKEVSQSGEGYALGEVKYRHGKIRFL